ncbi:MAG: hypothetical protein ACRCT8_07415 [Lacipirellulaceae bacterium]
MGCASPERAQQSNSGDAAIMARWLLSLLLAVGAFGPSRGESVEHVPAGATGDATQPVIARPIGEIDVDISIGAGQTPQNHAAEHGVGAAPTGAAALRVWPVQAKAWSAANSRHHPLYFEQVNAERYGYGCRPCLQPVASTAHFCASAVALPYQLAADCPRACVYTLGHYRPGDCAPRQAHYWPCSVKGGAAQALTVVGLVALIP